MSQKFNVDDHIVENIFGQLVRLFFKLVGFYILGVVLIIVLGICIAFPPWSNGAYQGPKPMGLYGDRGLIRAYPTTNQHFGNN